MSIPSCCPLIWFSRNNISEKRKKDCISMRIETNASLLLLSVGSFPPPNMVKCYCFSFARSLVDFLW